jgi:hypothetical protein
MLIGALQAGNGRMLIDFCGYSGDCTVHGQIDLPAGRLTDALDSHGELTIHGMVLRSLADPTEVHAGDQQISLDDLFALQATAPAGPEARRVRTVRELVRVSAGPYVIYGETHALPGIGGLRAFHARRGLVPLTNCQVLFERCGRPTEASELFLLVNPRLVDSVEPGTQEQYLEEREERAATLTGAQPGAADAVA